MKRLLLALLLAVILTLTFATPVLADDPNPNGNVGHYNPSSHGGIYPGPDNNACYGTYSWRAPVLPKTSPAVIPDQCPWPQAPWDK